MGEMQPTLLFLLKPFNSVLVKTLTPSVPVSSKPEETAYIPFYSFFQLNSNDSTLYR